MVKILQVDDGASPQPSEHHSILKSANNAVTRLTMLTDWETRAPCPMSSPRMPFERSKAYLVSVRELNSIASNSQDLTRTSC